MTSIRERVRETATQHRQNLVIGFLLQTFTLLCLVYFLLIGGKGSYEAINSFRLKLLLLALGSSTAQAIHAGNSKKISSLKSVYDDYIKKGLSAEISSSQIFDKQLTEIASLENLVRLVDGMPDYKKRRYMEQYKLQGLLRPAQQPTAQPEQITSSTVQVRKALPVFDKKVEQILDVSWMNHDFFFRSGCVTGDEGSGKTQMLAYIALNIMAICPDVDIKIHSIHYDPDDRWFPNMPLEIEESLIISNPRECMNDMLNVYSELRNRELSKDRTKHPIIRITDEFQGLADILGKDDWTEYVNAIIQIKNRGRKYARKVDKKDTGIRVWCGTHSLKQKMTKLDSSFFAGSNVLCLGDSIKDTSTPFPSDFDVKSLTHALTMCKAQLIDMGLMSLNNPSTDKARPAVVRIARGNPGIKVIPKPDLSTISFEILPDDYVGNIDDALEPNAANGNNADVYPGSDYMEKIKAWYRSNSQCTDEDLKAQMLILTGKIVSDEIVSQLRGILDES